MSANLWSDTNSAFQSLFSNMEIQSAHMQNQNEVTSNAFIIQRDL